MSWCYEVWDSRYADLAVAQFAGDWVRRLRDPGSVGGLVEPR